MVEKVYLDLDGVFADFDQAIRDYVDPLFIDGHIDNKMMWPIFEKVPNLFYNLKVIDGSLELYHRLKHLNPIILTAVPIPRGNLVTAKQDKARWVRENISEDIPIICVNSWKYKVQYANNWRPGNEFNSPHNLLIDDMKRNIDMWKLYGGLGIVHKNAEETLAMCDIMEVK